MPSWKQFPVVLAAVLISAGACGPGSHDEADVPDSATSGAPAADAHAGDAHAGDARAGESAAHGHSSSDSGMTLLAIMQRLGGNMASLTHGIMTQDTQAVRQQATAIAEHAPIATTDLARIKETLGGDMPAFEAVDESVHVAAGALSDAARAGEFQTVLSRLNEVQRGCVSCHTQFRDRLRTNPAPR